METIQQMRPVDVAIILGAFVVACFGIFEIIDRIRNPWAYKDEGKPMPITGDSYGSTRDP